MKCIYIATNKYDEWKIDWLKEVCATNKWGKLCMVFWIVYIYCVVNITIVNEKWNDLYIYKYTCWECELVRNGGKWSMNIEMWIVYVLEKWLKCELKMCM